MSIFYLFCFVLLHILTNNSTIFEKGISSFKWHVKSASYLYIHLEVDNKSRLIKKIYDKRDKFNFPSVNFHILCSNIPETPAYEVYISQFKRHSRTCISYYNFLDGRLLLTRKELNQEFQVVKLKSSFYEFYGRHREGLRNICFNDDN